jgi:hypothetical protein
MKGYDKKKLKFWLIGASISLTGACIVRFELLKYLGIRADINTIVGLLLAFSGLFLITLATRKKAS